MKLTSKNKSGLRGFSLVELLVVIAVIGIIAAIAIPNIANLTGSAEKAKDQRNAQNIVSVASAARAAGVTNVWADEDAVITDLTDGITYKTMSFSISPLSAAEISGAKVYFGVNSNQPFYDPNATN